MVRCVVLYNDSTNCNITLLRDDNVIVNCMGDYCLDSFLFKTDVDSLHVIYKPSIAKTVPENGYKIGSISINNIIKSCVISSDEVKRLADYASVYNVKDVRIYNYIDLVVDRYKSEDSIISIFEWTGNHVGIAYIEMGELIEFRRIKDSKLTTSLSKLRQRYNCNNVVQFDSGFDFGECFSRIHNMKLVSKDKQIFLSHIPYVIENNGISLLENPTTVSILQTYSNDEDGVSIYTTESDNESNYEVATDVDDIEIKPLIVNKEPKLGFFSRLFGKSKKSDSSKYSGDSKRKESGFNFEEYTEEQEDEDEEIFSQVAKGVNSKASYNHFGANPSMKRKYKFFDYLFYTVFVIFFTSSVVVGGLQLVYKEKLSILSGEYDSAIKVKNQIETNVRLSSDSSKSPSTKITQLSGLNLPSSFSIRNVDYDGTQYKINIETAHDDNIDTIKEYLPSDLVISSINPLNIGDVSDKSNKIYEIVLLVS